MSTISVGSTLNIQFSFLVNGELVDPDNIVGEIFLYDDVTGEYPVAATETFSAVKLSTGIYDTDWIASAEGRYKIKLTGSFLDSIDDLVHVKYFIIGDLTALNTLDALSLVSILGEVEPLYIDPEYILQYFPSGDLVEITEIIHRKSLELEKKIGCDPIGEVTESHSDFIIAATMCDLSRIYGFSNGGLNGFSGSDSFKLGDLEVENSGSSGRLAAGKYDVGNADSWCELATSLKFGLTSTKDTMRSVVPGADHLSPIPNRYVKSSDF